MNFQLLKNIVDEHNGFYFPPFPIVFELILFFFFIQTVFKIYSLICDFFLNI